MWNESEVAGVALGARAAVSSTTRSVPSTATEAKRWSTGRKKQVVLRLLRGESVADLSREVEVPIYKIKQWHDHALAGMDAGLNEREHDPREKQLYEANRRICELVMALEILCKEWEAKRPMVGKR